MDGPRHKRGSRRTLGTMRALAGACPRANVLARGGFSLSASFAPQDTDNVHRLASEPAALGKSGMMGRGTRRGGKEEGSGA